MVQSPPDPSRKPLAILLWILVILLFVPCLCFGGCAGLGLLGLAGGAKAADHVLKQQEAAKSQLHVKNMSSSHESGVSYVTGTITNDSAQNFSYVQISISLEDKSGSVVGSTMANVNNLGPHKSWKFKAIVLEDDARKFEVKDITAF